MAQVMKFVNGSMQFVEEFVEEVKELVADVVEDVKEFVADVKEDAAEAFTTTEEVETPVETTEDVAIEEDSLIQMGDFSPEEVKGVVAEEVIEAPKKGKGKK